MKLCSDDHTEICYDDDRWNQACPLCLMRKDLTEKIDALEGEAADFRDAISAMNRQLAEADRREPE